MKNLDKWNAVANNDKSYDGVFYYAVKTTGIFCRPSCNSKLPNRENVIFYNSQQVAIDNGYRPCKRCRPDLYEYSPINDIAVSIKNIIDKSYNRNLNNALLNLNVSYHRIAEIFKEKYNLTMQEYINKLKIDKSCKMLNETDLKIKDISLELGYNSVSAFYTFFKKQKGITPNKYRGQNK